MFIQAEIELYFFGRRELGVVWRMGDFSDRACELKIANKLSPPQKGGIERDDVLEISQERNAHSMSLLTLEILFEFYGHAIPSTLPIPYGLFLELFPRPG